MKKLTTEEFIKKAREVHSNRYDYSKVIYYGSSKKVIITCFIHGDFEQNPGDHLAGKGCGKCAGNIKSNTEEFIKKAIKIHGDKYNYNKTKYVDVYIKVIIICHKHGEFKQTPHAHLTKRGCKKCKDENTGNRCRSNAEEFIKKAMKAHNNKYNYDKIKYKNNKTPVTITCYIHGDFFQTPSIHLAGSGCGECAGNIKSNTKEFIKKAREIHGDRYDYSNVEYKGNKKKIKIICKIHGEFFQIAGNHLRGCDCPKCKCRIGEMLCIGIFEILFSCKFPKCRPKWLKNPSTGYLLEFDGYNKERLIAVEYQGEQHYKEISKFKGEFKKQKERDKIKIDLCKKHNVLLIAIRQFRYNKAKYIKKRIKETLENININFDLEFINDNFIYSLKKKLYPRSSNIIS